MIFCARPLNLLVGCLVVAAMPGVAFAGAPAPGPAAADLGDPPPPAPLSQAPAAPQPYAPPPPAAPQGYPPPGAYPAYPPPAPGYPYPPPAYAPPAYFTAQRLVLVEAEIRDLTARRDGITFGGPVVLIVGGVAAFVAGVALISASTCTSSESQYGLSCSEHDDDDQAFGSLLVLSGVAGATVGIIQSIIRGAKRGSLARRIVTRQGEAAALRSLHPTWGVVPVRGGGGALGFNF